MGGQIAKCGAGGRGDAEGERRRQNDKNKDGCNLYLCKPKFEFTKRSRRQ
jgi:hypothetical protein